MTGKSFIYIFDKCFMYLNYKNTPARKGMISKDGIFLVLNEPSIYEFWKSLVKRARSKFFQSPGVSSFYMIIEGGNKSSERSISKLPVKIILKEPIKIIRMLSGKFKLIYSLEMEVN